MIKLNLKFIRLKKFKLVLVALPILALTIASILFVTHTYIRNNKSPIVASECSNLPKSAKLQCWESAIEETLKKQGLEEAFVLLDNLYNKEPEFSSECHGYTHKLGQEAYYLFAKQRSINLTEKALYCGYGFYHGFMETLLKATGNLEEARSFCNMVGSRLASQPRARDECYHGIGHGFVDGSDPRAWGNVDTMIAPGLTLCQKFSTNDKDVFRCSTGVFNSLAIMMSANQYGLEPNKKDPYKLCLTFQQKSIKEACYREMNIVILRLGNNQLKQAAKYVEKIIDDHYADYAMRGLAGIAAYAYLTESDFSENILDCQSLQPRLQIDCIHSFAEGLIIQGSPGEEHIKAVALCQSPLLTTSQRDLCFQSSFAYLKRVSARKQYETICQNIDELLRKYCLK